MNLCGNSKANFTLHFHRCTTDTLNGTDLRGIILVCTQGGTFPDASQYVLNGGGSGLIFAQYTTDILTVTTSNACESIACVLVDLDTGEKIGKYIDDTRYTISSSFLQ
jgi:hypothetical protein